jgi:DNA polymerase
MANCRPYLDQQIEIVRPHAILCLGAPSAKSFLGPKFSITKQRGLWFEGPAGIPLMATFHPAYILRMTGGELDATKRLVWNDLKALRAKLDAPPPRLPEPEIAQPSFFDADL